MEAIQQIQSLLQEAEQIAKEDLGLDNIFYNERFVEMFMANHLGHEYGNNTPVSYTHLTLPTICSV